MSMTTQASVDFARYCEQEGLTGSFTVPPYVLINQTAAFYSYGYLHELGKHTMVSITILQARCSDYAETIKKLSDAHPIL